MHSGSRAVGLSWDLEQLCSSCLQLQQVHFSAWVQSRKKKRKTPGSAGGCVAIYPWGRLHIDWACEEQVSLAARIALAALDLQAQLLSVYAYRPGVDGEAEDFLRDNLPKSLAHADLAKFRSRSFARPSTEKDHRRWPLTLHDLATGDRSKGGVEATYGLTPGPMRRLLGDRAVRDRCQTALDELDSMVGELADLVQTGSQEDGARVRACLLAVARFLAAFRKAEALNADVYNRCHGSDGTEEHYASPRSGCVPFLYEQLRSWSQI